MFKVPKQYTNPMRIHLIILLVLIGDLLTHTVSAVTVQNFDAADCDVYAICDIGTPCIATQYANPPAPTLKPGGPTEVGCFLRLASVTTAPANFNTIAFDKTDLASDQIIADFDFRIRPKSSRADGFGFALLNTANYGDSGAEGGTAEEPKFEGSLGIGFDVYRNAELGDDGNDIVRLNFSNTLSVHFNGKVLTQVDATPVVDLAGGQWIHARIIMRPGAGPSDVSVILKPRGCKPVTVIDRFPVPGFTPYAGRVHFGARSGSESANHDLDNIRVQFLSSSKSVLSLGSVTYNLLENKPAALITATRTGDTQGTATVGYTTVDVTATAGSDYTATSGQLTFTAGQTKQSFSVPLLDDPAQEGNEIFKVSLSNPGGQAVVGGPKTATVTIIDDETARLVGRWSTVMCWPIVAIHMHLLPTGKVMFWDRPGNHALWDPVTKLINTVAQPEPDYDMFCSGHSFLEDGHLLVTGGHADPEGHPSADGVGLPNASAYNPFEDRWESLPDMNAGRWYPTNTTLAKGDVLVVSGSIDSLNRNSLPQVWQPASGSWRDLVDAQNLIPLGADLYPRMFLTPHGEVFKAGPDRNTWYLDTAGSGQWTPGPPSHFAGVRTYGTAVMYEAGKILIVGGDGENPPTPPTQSAEVINLNVATPTWRTVSPMAFPRRQHNATVLPNGKVLVTGGSQGSGFNNEAAPVRVAELWDPKTKKWETLSAMQVPRLYHSTALLLPDGRVLSAGGGQAAVTVSFQNNAEIYSPPYLFRGIRPKISSIPEAVSYGETFFVQTSDIANIDKVSLIRLPSVTHSFDQNQRFISLRFSQVVSGLEIVAPESINLAPPGHYMLFILNTEGIPSVAKIIQIVSPG